VYISSLRTKVDRDYPQKLIQTNRGIGYTLTSGSIFASASNEKRSISHDRAHFLS
jgi:hypothetical protein